MNFELMDDYTKFQFIMMVICIIIMTTLLCIAVQERTLELIRYLKRRHDERQNRNMQHELVPI